MSASGMRAIFEADFPTNGPPRQKLGYALKYAMLAPTEVIRQPWDFRVTNAFIDLIARNEPGTSSFDPDGREFMISCGAALLYLKLALKHFGCLGRVELFPDLDQPALAARIHFGFGHERDDQEKLLFKAMTGLRACPAATRGSPVSQTTLTALSRAVASERGWVEFVQSEISRQRLMELSLAGERRRMGTVGFRDRSVFQAGHRSATTPSEGARRTAPGWLATRWTKPILALTVRRNDSGRPAVKLETQPPPPTTTLAVVKTKTDEKHGWLAAGQTMARVILQAQALGLSWSFFNQAVRRRNARETLRTGIGRKGFAQAILRLGSLTTTESFQTTSTESATATFR